MAKVKTPHWARALTSLEHFFKECLGTLGELGEVDLFVSRAASKAAPTYKTGLKNTARLKSFERTVVAVSLANFKMTSARCKRELHG